MDFPSETFQWPFKSNALLKIITDSLVLENFQHTHKWEDGEKLQRKKLRFNLTGYWHDSKRIDLIYLQ